MPTTADASAPSRRRPPVAPVLDPATTSTKPGRIESLDVARGLMLITSILSVSWFAGRPPAINVHAFWDGPVTGIDWIFPMFVTLSGCGLAFAYRNRIGWGSTIRRSVVLLIVGLIYNAVTQASRDGVSLATLKVTGPLTMYAVLCLAIGLLHLVLRGWKAWFGFSVLLALGYSLYLWSYAQGCPDDVLTRACNPSGEWDPRIFGERI
ncbi:MAG: heparan-alpha-glucosaminide N-acetyltransferase domain-containing protein, partial [Gaiellales bacterium]